MSTATYRQAEIAEYEGNPLEEALPPILDDANVLRSMTHYPTYSHDERQAPAHVRIHMLDRMTDFFQALPEHLRVERTISRLIRSGYKSRNPLCPAHAQLAYRIATQDPEKAVAPRGYATCSKAAYFFALSGMGKTRTCERALCGFPQVISHQKYCGKPFIHTQVTYIKIDCPHDGSIRTYLLSILAAIDDLIPGCDYYQQWSRARGGVEALVPAIFRVLHNYHVGLVIQDEMNNITSAPGGGDIKFLNLNMNIINKLGIPHLHIGTNESAALFKRRVRNSRRVSFGGNLQLERLRRDDPRWELFMKALWHYQWTKTEIPLTPETVESMYDASQGIFDVAVNIYMCVQEAGIQRGKDESFDARDIRLSVPRHLPILQPALEALKNGDLKGYERFRELLPPSEHWREASNKSDNKADLEKLLDTLVEQQVADQLALQTATRNQNEDVSEGSTSRTKTSAKKHSEINKSVAKGKRKGNRGPKIEDFTVEVRKQGG